MMLYKTGYILERIKGKWFHINSTTICYVEDHLLRFKIEGTKDDGSKHFINLTESPYSVTEKMADFLLHAFYNEVKE